MIHPQLNTSAIVAAEVDDLLYSSSMATAAIPLDLTTTPSSEALPPLAFEVEVIETTELDEDEIIIDSSEVSLDETSHVIALTSGSVSMYSDQTSFSSDDTFCHSDSNSGMSASTSVVMDAVVANQNAMPMLEDTSYDPLVETSELIVTTTDTPIDLSVTPTSSMPMMMVDVPVSADGFVDETLARAAMQAVTTGKMTSLIKEELRCTIQTKRLSEGKDELEVTVDDDDQPECLTTEEETKREKRRERNKYAAQRCRYKKRALADRLEEETECLESANKKLKTDIDKLHEEKERLVLMLRSHDVTYRHCGRTLSSDLEDD